MLATNHSSEDTQRVERLRREMAADGIDALFLRLPENILYVSGFWPVSGFCAALFPLEGDPVLYIPTGEVDYAQGSWVREVHVFPAGTLTQPSYYEVMAPGVRSVGQRWGLRDAVIGYEGSFDLVATAHWQGEVRVPSAPTLDLVRAVSPEARLRDATPALRRARAVKSAREIAAIRQACAVARLGLDAGRDLAQPGITEIEIAQEIQRRIALAVVDGEPTIERTGGFATVMSGPLSANARLHFNISSTRRLEPGDHFTVELGAYADGYWSDLTRVYAVGDPGDRFHELVALVRRAQEAAIQALRPGVRARDVDHVARSIIAEAGYGDQFPHGLGHSIGLQWHEPPLLHPASDHVLRVGEIYTIEPGVYLDGWGGVRLEEVVVVTESGGEVLSN